MESGKEMKPAKEEEAVAARPSSSTSAENGNGRAMAGYNDGTATTSSSMNDHTNGTIEEQNLPVNGCAANNGRSQPMVVCNVTGTTMSPADFYVQVWTHAYIHRYSGPVDGVWKTVRPTSDQTAAARRLFEKMRSRPDTRRPKGKVLVDRLLGCACVDEKDELLSRALNPTDADMGYILHASISEGNEEKLKNLAAMSVQLEIFDWYRHGFVSPEVMKQYRKDADRRWRDAACVVQTTSTKANTITTTNTTQTMVAVDPTTTPKRKPVLASELVTDEVIEHIRRLEEKALAKELPA